MKETWNSLKENWKYLGLYQKVSIFVMGILVIAIPLVVSSTLTLQYIKSQAQTPITPPITPPNPTEEDLAIVLGGSSYIEVNNSASLNPKLSYTVEGWFKPDSPEFSSTLINKTTTTGNTNSSYQIYAVSDIDLGRQVYVVSYMFNVADPETQCNFRTITNQITYPLSDSDIVTSWHHVAGVIQKDGKMDLFVDGQRTLNTNYTSGVCPSTSTIQVGVRDQGTGYFDGYFKGQVNNFRISNIARYTGNFDPGTITFDWDSNTIILYKLDGISANYNQDNYYGIIHGSFNYVPVSYEPTPTAGLSPTNSPTPTTSPMPTPVLLPDLSIVDPIIINPNPAFTTDNVYIAFKLKNVGQAIASPAQYSYINQSGGYSTLDPSNTCHSNTTLQPGSYCTSAYTFKFSTTGTKIMKVKLDSNNLVAEANENNNEYTFTVNVVTPTTVPVSPTIAPLPSPTVVLSPPITPSPAPVCRWWFFRRCILWSTEPTPPPQVPLPEPTSAPCRLWLFDRCLI